MSLTECMVSAQHNRPVVGMTQDSLTALYLMTRRGVYVTREEFQQYANLAYKDLPPDALVQRIDDFLSRVFRKRSPDHQQYLDGAVRARLGELEAATRTQAEARARLESNRATLSAAAYTQQQRAIENASRTLDDYERRARELVASQVRNAAYSAAGTSASFDQWSYELFRREQGLSSEDFNMLTSTRVLGTEQKRYNELTYRYQAWLLTDPTANADDIATARESIVLREVQNTHYLTGRELFSFVLPPDYFYTKKNEADALEPTVTVSEGILTKGTVDKKIMGATHNSMIQDLYKMYSPAAAEDLMSRAKWLSDPWLKKVGFTFSMNDCAPNPSYRAVSPPPAARPANESKEAEVAREDREAEAARQRELTFPARVQEEIEAARIQAWVAGPRSSNPLEEMDRQERIRSALCNVKTTTGKLAMARIDPSNSVAAMVQSGSKGSMANFASIMTLVGSQEWQGRPIANGPGGYSIPCFERNSRDPTASGFVASDYVKGMTPAELFMHQFAAREGLLGTATKTAETGYMQRRIVKALEDAVVYPDGSVRNTQGVIIQYAYGEDGFSGERLVLSENKSRFVDIGRLVSDVKARREAALETKYTPYVDPRPRYVMPSFQEDDADAVEAIEADEDEDAEKKEDGDEEADDDNASDLSDDGGGEDDEEY